MSAVKYLYKRATAYDTPLSPHVAQMYNLIDAASKHKGIPLRRSRVTGESPMGPAMIPGWGVGAGKDDQYINIDSPSIALMSHELGHLQANHDKTGLSFTSMLPIPLISEWATLPREAQANRKSYEMLKQLYGDDKKLMDAIDADRRATLPIAYSTYAVNAGVPTLTTALGGYLGYRRYNRLKKDYDEQVNNINKQIFKSKKQKDEELAKLKAPSKFKNIGGGAALGYLGGKVITQPIIMAMTPALDKAMTRSVEYNRENNILGMMKEHAKRNGYWTEDLGTRLNGQNDLSNPVPDSMQLVNFPPIES